MNAYEEPHFLVTIEKVQSDLKEEMSEYDLNTFNWDDSYDNLNELILVDPMKAHLSTTLAMEDLNKRTVGFESVDYDCT